MAEKPNLVKSKETEKVTLFKFRNIANPAKKTPSASSTNSFMQNDNAAASAFVVAAEGASNEAERDAAVKAVADSYNAYTSALEVMNVNMDLYKLSEFLPTFKRTTPEAKVIEKTESLTELNEDEMNILWDNVYYQAVTNKSAIITDTLVNMLRAQAFLVAYREDGMDEEEEPDENDPCAGEFPLCEEIKDSKNGRLVRLASAGIVIPNKLVSRTAKDSETPNIVNADSRKGLLKRNTADIARYKAKGLDVLMGKVKNIAHAYSKKENEAINKAYEKFEQSRGSARNYVSHGAKRSETYSADFDYTPSDPFDREFTKDYLSDIAMSYIESFKTSEHETWEDILPELEKFKNEQLGIVFDNRTPKGKTGYFKGIEIPVDDYVSDNSFVIASEEIPGSDLRAIFFTQYFKSEETAIESLNITVSGGSLTASQNFESTEPIYRSENHVTYLLFDDGLPEGDGYNIQASYKLGGSDEDLAFEMNDQKLDKRPKFDICEYIGSILDSVPGNDSVKLFGVKQIGVLEYKRVEQTICCYVAGEVSHIENIMAREYKEKTSRTLNRTEIIQEDTKETEVENLKDTTSTDRYEMQKEISQVLQEEQSRQIAVNAGLDVSTKIPPANTTIGVNVGTDMSFSNSTSQTNSLNISESFAKEVTERALERVIDKTISKRTSRILREHEETDKHGFDNRAGDKHVTGIYRWVDKIYKNELVNYGKRLLYDFMVPEPSRNFKKWIVAGQQQDPPPGPLPIKPKDVTSFGIINWTSINKGNYAKVAAEYGADVEPCPDSYISIIRGYGDTPGQLATEKFVSNGGYKYVFEIPEGYQCTSYKYTWSHSWHGDDKDSVRASVKVGESIKTFPTNTFLASYISPVITPSSTASAETDLGVSVEVRDVGAFSLNVRAYCELKSDVYQAWQQTTYMAIITAYKKRLEEYNNLLAASAQQPIDTQPDYNYNPGIGRSLEKRELKRICIEMMLRPFGYQPVGWKHYYAGTHHDIVKQDFALEYRSMYVKFMEEAFSWDLMSYYFYPYYWGGEEQWETLINESSTSDPLFEAFLQSGMARVSVPVRIGYEKAVTYFLSTGIVWPTNYASTDGDVSDLYLSIAELLEIEEGCVEARWKTRVPTALTILQSSSAPLDEDGLPCDACCEDGTPIASGNNILAGIPGDGSTSGSNDGSTGSLPGAPSQFRFPKHENLSALDVGKLVMNDGDGLAKVYELSDALAEQTGRFIIKLADIGDLTDASTITIETSSVSFTWDRPTWRNGASPSDAEDELDALAAFISAEGALSNLTATVVSGELVIEETAVESTRIELSGWPLFDSLVVERVSRPASPIAAAGFPLGKLLAIDGDEAIISGELVQTYTLESPITINNEIFNSGYEFNLNTVSDFSDVFGNIIVPADSGKVKPLGLTPSDITRDFWTTYRNQFVGIAISTDDLEVTVMKISYMSYLWQLLRKTKGEAIFDSNGSW